MNKIFNRQFYVSLIIIAITIIAYLILKIILNKLIKKNSKNNKKLTYIKMLNSIIKYVLIIVDILYILYEYGINVTGIAAGLGIVTLVVTLSLQDALKDIIMGINLIVDNYFNVGDVIEVNGITGKVLEIGFKATKILDTKTNNIYIVANRNLSSALNISDWLDIDIPLPYEEHIKSIEELITLINEKIAKLPKVDKVEYKGLQEFGDSAIYYKIRIYSKPEYHPEVKRNANRIIKLEIDEKGISIPYMQIDMHNKK